MESSGIVLNNEILVSGYTLPKVIIERYNALHCIAVPHSEPELLPAARDSQCADSLTVVVDVDIPP